MKSYNGFTAAQRQKAGNWKREQYRLGLRQPPYKCCVCGQTEGPIHSHCEDYSEPFGDHLFKYPMCFACHMMVHCRFRAPNRWVQYKQFIANGYRYTPINDFFTFTRVVLNGQDHATITAVKAMEGDIEPLQEIERWQDENQLNSMQGQLKL